MLFDMKRPSPVPVVDFVANFVNSLGNISESMPMPVSLILTTISVLFGTGSYTYSAFICKFNSVT